MTTSNVTAMHLSFEPGLAPFAAGARPALTIDGDDAHACRPWLATSP